MKIVRPYASIVNLDADALEVIERRARVSHRSENAPPNTTRFIQSVVLDHGDWSVVEHVSATVEFLVDRGLTHEIVRHRHFSYTQESTRFVNYAKKMPPAFIYPQDVFCEHEDHDLNNETTWSHECPYSLHWINAIQNAESSYRNLLDSGWSPQLARSVFPNALAAKLLMTGNLRAWRHFLRMRTTKEAHPQLRQVTIPLLEQFKQRVPLLFDDIEPLARQIDNLGLPA